MDYFKSIQVMPARERSRYPRASLKNSEGGAVRANAATRLK
jgi:hypothetical protein